MSTVAVVDYGMGNRRSVEKAFEHVGAEVRVTGDHEAIRDADAVVVPGVGAFPEAMRRLSAAGLDGVIRERAAHGHAGARHLPRHAAAVRGLRRARGRRRARPAARRGHRRWRRRSCRTSAGTGSRSSARRASPRGSGEAAAFYHVHSFVCRPREDGDVIGRGEYGERFASIVERDNVAGVQFHPEKSSRDGLALLANFVAAA